LARPISSKIFAPLLSARGSAALRSGLVAFLPRFFAAATLPLARLAVFWALGAAFFWVAPVFEEAFSGATCAPCARPVPQLWRLRHWFLTLRGRQSS
jgi:hypothetical protein